MARHSFLVATEADAELPAAEALVAALRHGQAHNLPLAAEPDLVVDEVTVSCDDEGHVHPDITDRAFWSVEYTVAQPRRPLW